QRPDVCRRPRRFREFWRGRGAARWAAQAPRRRPRHQPVARRRVPGGIVRRQANREPRVQDRPLCLQLLSLHPPPPHFTFKGAKGQRSLRKQQEIPSGFDPSHYEVQRRMAPARDGVQVPVSILMKKGTPLDGSSPLFLYAYGSYGITTEATFNSNVLSLVDRGMTFAIAHVRGGQEMGRQW